MSVLVANQDLTTAVVGTTGTIDFSNTLPPATIQDQMQGPRTTQATLLIFNRTPCGLAFATGPGIVEEFDLPDGNWYKLAVHAGITQANYTVAYVVPNGTVFKLRAILYLPGEEVDETGAISGGTIGGSTTTLASQLGNSNEGLTVAAAGVGVPVGIDTLLPYSSTAGASRDVAIAVLDGGIQATAINFLHTGGIPTTDVVGSLFLAKTITSVNGQATAGFGMPLMVIQPTLLANITATTQQTIASYTTPNDGNPHAFEAAFSCNVNNGTAPNALLAQATYTDAFTHTASRGAIAFGNLSGSASMLTLGGSVNQPNGVYSLKTGMFWVDPNTTITLVYRDPTNTPSDSVVAWLMRLS